MNHSIISFLDFNPDELSILKIEILDNIKFVHLIKPLKPVFCPHCHSRMHSKGQYIRSINHPILQDGFQLVLKLHQRRWVCSNPSCHHTMNDDFSFVQKNHRNTDLTIIGILRDMKNLSLSASFIADKYHVSDTYVHETFLRYVDCKRLPLPEILSVDEVYLEFDSKNRYALVLMDFLTGEIVDILPNRFKDTYQHYFHSIPLEERNQVKYLICDMYNPYINFVHSYLHHAKPVVDSFHVIQWINHKINIYINTVKKKYLERDRKLLEKKNQISNREYQSPPLSDEVYLLNQYRWILLASQSHINYSYKKYYNRHFKQYLCTYDYEKKFLELDPRFEKIRKLKELYIKFNDSFPKPHAQAEKELDALIFFYQKQELLMFQEFSQLLQKYKREIVYSFTDLDHSLKLVYVNTLSETGEQLKRRLSNGPIESFNRKPKDLKRNSRGFENSYYTINRILWANRKNQPILAVPKPAKEVKNHTGKIRGKYTKKK